MVKKDLEKEIKKHQDLYYAGKPEISDEEFDVLWDTLRSEFPESELLQEVGSTSIDENKLPHEMSMGSQDKITSTKEIEDWIRLKNIHGDLVLEYKIDGCSVELIYENGVLQTALSRGNGLFGTDITKNIVNVPRVFEKGRFSVRGEIVLKKEDFEKMEKQEGAISLRNIATGLSYQKNTAHNIDKLSVICYDTNKPFPTESEKMNWLEQMGFETTGYILADSKKISKIEDVLKVMENNRDKLPYAIDGVVIKQNTIPTITDDRKRPLHQRAFKWQSEAKQTTLLDVEWSRNGNNYTPVAILKPVELAGTVVSRASLANVGIMNKLGITKNCTVVVSKKGEIIPQIMSVVEDGENSFQPPSICSFCGNELSISDTKISCENKQCETVLEHRIMKWMDTVEVLGFGPAIIEYLFREKQMIFIKDYYCQKNFMKAIAGTNKKKTIQKAFADLWARSTISLEDFVAGFDIPTIGSKVVKLLIDAGYNSLDKLRKVNYNDLLAINGIGEERAKIFIEYMQELTDEMDDVLKTNKVKIKEVEETPRAFSGKEFCITGKLSRPRKEIESYIINNGGNILSSVSKNTSYLITNDTSSGSSKNEKAKKFGTKIITEEELYKIIK